MPTILVSSLVLGVVLVLASSRAQALDKKYVPDHPIRPQTDSERLNNFKPPPPMPKQPSAVEKAQNKVTYTSKSGITMRPDAGLRHGTPTVGVKGTFKNP